MDCKLAARLISSRIDGELDRAKTPALEAHLESCPVCSALEGAERYLRDAIRAAAPSPESGAPVLSPAQILLRSRRAFAEEASLVRVLQRVAALAAVLLVASGLAIGIGKTERPAKDLENPVRDVAFSEAPFEALIDPENSIFPGSPEFDGDWAAEE